MIKTEYSDDMEDNQVSSIKTWQVVSLTVAALLVVGIISFLVIRMNARPGLLAPNTSSKNVSAIPLATSSSGSLIPVNSNQSSTNQSSANNSNLSSSSINLQDNLPAGNSSQPATNSLQSTNTAQNTGQTINPNLPY